MRECEAREIQHLISNPTGRSHRKGAIVRLNSKISPKILFGEA